MLGKQPLTSEPRSSVAVSPLGRLSLGCLAPRRSPALWSRRLNWSFWLLLPTAAFLVSRSPAHGSSCPCGTSEGPLLPPKKVALGSSMLGQRAASPRAGSRLGVPSVPPRRPQRWPEVTAQPPSRPGPAAPSPPGPVPRRPLGLFCVLGRSPAGGGGPCSGAASPPAPPAMAAVSETSPARFCLEMLTNTRFLPFSAIEWLVLRNRLN